MSSTPSEKYPESEKVPDSVLICRICNKPVTAEVAKFDGHGKSIHEECYLSKVQPEIASSNAIQTGKARNAATRPWEIIAEEVSNFDLGHHLRLQSNQLKALVWVLGVLFFVVDMMLPADVNVAIFYCFVIVLCGWTGSLSFLWGAAVVFEAAILPGLLLSPPPLNGHISWVYWANRLFAMAVLALVAGLMHLRIRNVRLLESRNQELNTAIDEIKTLRGILLVCSYCKKIEANPKTWVSLESYVRKNSEAEFNHGVCPDCLRKLTQAEVGQSGRSW